MTNTLLRYLSTTEKFLLSSTKFWSTLSTVAVIAAFYTIPQQYTNSKHINSAFIIIGLLHLIIFISDPKTLKNTFTPFFLGSFKKWAMRFTAMRAVSLLYYVPEQSVVGLIFVICVWIDVIAITRILKPSMNLWVGYSVFMAVGARISDLYGFTAHYWVMIMLFLFPALYMQIRLEGYKDDEETKEKQAIDETNCYY